VTPPRNGVSSTSRSNITICVCVSPDRHKSERAWRYGNRQIAQDRHKAARLALLKSEYEEQEEEAEMSLIERERARRERE
jgi:hypothetical protein